MDFLLTGNNLEALCLSDFCRPFRLQVLMRLSMLIALLVSQNLILVYLFQMS